MMTEMSYVASSTPLTPYPDSGETATRSRVQELDSIGLISISHVINNTILNFSPGTKMSSSAKVNKTIYF